MKLCKYCALPEFCDEFEESKYCDDSIDILTKDKALKINGIPFADIWIDIYGDELRLNITNSGEILDVIHFSTRKIKYCPMCGRKLKKAQD